MTKIERLYLNNLKNILTDFHRLMIPEQKTIFRIGSFKFIREKKVSIEKRYMGEDWPQYAETMIGVSRMTNLQVLIGDIICEDVEGDIVEAGVWRGGASIFMKANLLARKSDKRLYVCDSFCGLPKPKLPEDAGDGHWKIKYLNVGLGEVILNFSKYELLDENVFFEKGWFSDTMPALAKRLLSEERKISLLRLDGDMYQSTIDVLANLYPLVSSGGYVIIDDYVLPPCKKAVSYYRATHGITDPIKPIDNTAVYWRKK